MGKIKICFRFGRSTIDWNPEYVYLEVFKGDRKKCNGFDKFALWTGMKIKMQDIHYNKPLRIGENVLNTKNGSEFLRVGRKEVTHC